MPKVLKSPEHRLLDSMGLSDALWWFIENVDDDHPARTDLFFYLRERMRKGA